MSELREIDRGLNWRSVALELAAALYALEERNTDSVEHLTAEHALAVFEEAKFLSAPPQEPAPEGK